MAEWQTNKVWQDILAYTNGYPGITPANHEIFRDIELTEDKSGLTIARRHQIEREIGESAMAQTMIECLTEEGVEILESHPHGDRNPVIARIVDTITVEEKPFELRIEFDKDGGRSVSGRTPLPQPEIAGLLSAEWEEWGASVGVYQPNGENGEQDLWPIRSENLTETCLARLALLFGEVRGADN